MQESLCAGDLRELAGPTYICKSFLNQRTQRLFQILIVGAVLVRTRTVYVHVRTQGKNLGSMVERHFIRAFRIQNILFYNQDEISIVQVWFVTSMLLSSSDGTVN